MAEVLGRVQAPSVPQAAPRQVVGKPALGGHPRASVLSARGPRRTSQNGACTSPHKSPPPELTPAESADYETNKSSTHKYKTYNKCIGKYPKLSPNAQPGKYRQMELLSHAQQLYVTRVVYRRLQPSVDFAKFSLFLASFAMQATHVVASPPKAAVEAIQAVAVYLSSYTCPRTQ